MSAFSVSVNPHSLQAEEHLASVEKDLQHLSSSVLSGETELEVAIAQVHATLALADETRNQTKVLQQIMQVMRRPR